MNDTEARLWHLWLRITASCAWCCTPAGARRRGPWSGRV